MAGRITQEVHGFLGVDLRKERMSLANEDLAKAINADLHTQPGAIVLRLGRTRQFETALSESVVRRLARINSIRYQVAGQRLYRNQTEILSGLSGNLLTSLLPFRPLNDTTLWAFIADDAAMRKDDGSTTPLWGIAAPTATPGVGTTGTGLTGTYLVKFTYVRKSGSSVAHESNPSPASAAQALVNQNLAVTGLTASSDAQVTHKRLYRTVAGGTTYLYDQEIANATTTATSSQADTALGAAVEEDNTVPPAGSRAAVWQEHLWLVSNTIDLYYSKRYRPESFPATQFLTIGNADDPLQMPVPLVGLLGVFSRLTKYRVIGSAATGFSAEEALSSRGTPSPLAAHATERGIFFVARDGAFLTSLIGADEDLSERIAPIFYGESVNGINAINWDAAGTICAESYKGRIYVALPTGTATVPNLLAVYSTMTKRWYFYDHPLRSLFYQEDTDDLIGGGATSGFAFILEDGTADAGVDIALDVETKDYFGQSTETRKLFLWARVDADTQSETLLVDLYVDGVRTRTASLVSARGRTLLPFPEGAIGYTWRLGFRYTGRRRIRIYGAAAVWLPLEAA